VHYDVYRQALGQHLATVPTDKAMGAVLGKEYLHLTVGTPITPAIVELLKRHGILQVEVSTSAPRVEFIMKPMTRNPLLNPDWMARLSHRYLKDSVLKGAHFGDATDWHSTHPVPAYAMGHEFGSGKDGRY
jgi:hypothetical protein